MSNNVTLNYYLLDPDGTEKFVFKDDLGVLEITRINTKPDRDIYCIPSMYECRLGCTICYLTINNIKGSNKKIKSTTIEKCISIINNVKNSGKNGIQLSIMGVGEPLLNIELINDLCNNENIDRVSIASIFPFIPDGLPDKLKIHYSLHNPIHEKRLKMIPNGKESFENVIKYLDKHKGDVEIHYTLVENENGGSEFVIAFLGKPSYALIVHECIHWVNAVFRYRGIKLDPKNDELQAYFTEWVFQKTVDILEENYV